MSLQFNRRCRVSLYNDAGEGLVIEDLRVRFQLTKTLLGYPTRGKVEIFNLSEQNVQRITKQYTTVLVEIAYAENEYAQLFTSNIMNFYKDRQGTDSIFALILSGNAPAWNGSVFSKTYSEGVPVRSILEDVVGSFSGVLVGTILDDSDWGAKLSGVTHVGATRDVLNKLARDYNFSWAIHDNQIDIIPHDKVLVDREVHVLTSATGLIGAPTLTELGADFRSLINPDIMLGRRVKMDSSVVQLGQEGLEFRKVRNTADGLYKVMDLRYLGDTRGNEWYCDIIGWIVKK